MAKVPKRFGAWQVQLSFLAHLQLLIIDSPFSHNQKNLFFLKAGAERKREKDLYLMSADL
jgi:hypothetical protein